MFKNTVLLFAVLGLLLCSDNFANSQGICDKEVKRTKLCEKICKPYVCGDFTASNKDVAIRDYIANEQVKHLEEQRKKAENTDQDSNVNQDGYFEEFESASFGNNLTQTQSFDGHNALIGLLHKAPNMSFNDEMLIDESKPVVLYDSNHPEIKQVRKTIVDISNTFFEDNIMYNLASRGVRGAAPVSMTQILGLIKVKNDVRVVRDVNQFFGTDTYDFYYYFAAIFKDSNLKIHSAVSVDSGKVEIPDVEYLSVDKLNEKFKQEFQVENDVFMGEQAQGFAYINANFDFENKFTELDGVYDFVNSDSSVCVSKYMKGGCRGMLSTDKTVLRFFLDDETFVDLTKDYSDFGQKTFVDAPRKFELIFPEFQLKSITKLESFTYNGNTHKLLKPENYGNFFFVANFHSSPNGFWLGEKRSVSQVDETASETQSDMEQHVPSVVVNSAFKMKVYYKNILIFEGIIDGSKNIRI